MANNDGDTSMTNNDAEATEAEAGGGDEEKKIKRSPNELMVDGVSEVVLGDGDNSCVLLSVTKMEGTCGAYQRT